MTQNIAVRVENLGKTYELNLPTSQNGWGMVFPHRVGKRKFTALEKLSFEVNQGECLGIIGCNGSGKSTLLSMVAGTLPPSTGNIYASGRMVSLLELGSYFNPSATGRENIYITGYMQGLSQEEIERHLDAIIEFAEIGDFIDQPLTTYSSGMSMRLAFATNINIDADILLLDEVFAVGDAKFVRKCVKFIRNFIKNKTVLFVSHDLGTVNTICDRALWLDHGHMAGYGPATEITGKYLEEVNRRAANPGDPAPESALDSPVNEAAPYPDFRRGNNANPIFVESFQPSGEKFGEGRAELLDAKLCDASGTALNPIFGGDTPQLRITGKALSDLTDLSVGFILKDSNGQYIFCGTNIDQPLPGTVRAGELFEAWFEFPLPRLQQGIYHLAVNVTLGSLYEHKVELWNHRALTLHADSPLPVRNVHLGVELQSVKSVAVSQK